MNICLLRLAISPVRYVRHRIARPSRLLILAPSLRCLTSSTKSSEAANLPKFVTTFRRYRPVILKTGAAVLGIGGVYFISSVVMGSANWFLSIPPHSFIWYGYIAGFFSAALCGGLIYATRRSVTIRPENVFRMSRKLVENNTEVQSQLGRYLTPGKLKAYKIDGGNITLEKKSGDTFATVPSLKPPRVQMLYNMFGDGGKEGMVSVEAVKLKGQLTLRMVAVDVGSNLILISGTEERLKVAGQLRGFLQAERAKYLSQDVEEDDDDVEPMLQ